MTRYRGVEEEDKLEEIGRLIESNNRDWWLCGLHESERRCRENWT